MKYPFGLVVFIFSIYAVIDLTIKSIFTRKRVLRKYKEEKKK